MKIAALVPYMLPFGGIRRFLEVGNVMASRGHDYTVYARDGEDGDLWMNYSAGMSTWEKAKFTFEADVVMIGDPNTLDLLEDPTVTISGKVYVWVIAAGLSMYLAKYKEYEAKGYDMIINTRLYLEHFPTARICEGGVNTVVFKPKALRVGYYAGRGSHKGEQHIVDSLKGLKHVIPVAIKGLGTFDLVKAYRRLDYFVCSETKEGWSNMSAEAIACGVPVVSDSPNTDPFEDRVINVKDLRAFFEDPMGRFSWEKVCDRLEEIWREDGL